ncbi:MAG: cell division protein SepF [Actinobacteria bacterium]|nr:cell division protein SepF [Actinomycetota bacterium]
MPVRFFLFPFDVSVSLKLLIYFAYFLASLSMYLYLSEIVGKKERSYIPICGSLIFTFSLPLLQFMWGISIVYGIAALPLLLWSSHKFDEKKPLKWIFLSSLCLLVSASHPFTLAVNAFLFILYNLLLLNRNWKQTSLAIVIFLLLFSWYILPYSLAPLTRMELGREPLSKGEFDFVSNNSALKIMTLARDKFLYIQTVPENDTLTTLWYFFLLIPFFFICLPVLFVNKIERKQIRIIFFFFFIYLFTTLLSLGSKGPFGEIYWSFVKSTDIGWIFRSPLKFQLYQAFAYSILFTFGLLVLRKLTNRQILIPALVVITLVGVSGYTLWYANTKDMTPVQVPAEFYQINNILQNTSDDSKVIWYPRYNERPTTWLDRPVAPFDMKSSMKDTYSTSQNYTYVEQYLYEKVYPKELKKPEFYDFLRAIGIKYLVFHNDRGLSLDNNALESIIDTIGVNSIIYSSNDWYLFNLSTSSPRVYLTNNVILSQNIKLSKYGAILIPDNNLNKTDLSAIEFLEENNVPKYFKEKNIVVNPSFENGINFWSVPKPTTYEVVIGTDAIDGEKSLRISTNATERGWLFITSSEIEVTPQETYMLQAYMKYLNMNGPHIKVQGFNTSKNKWDDIFFLTTSHFGSSEWKQYIGYLDVPENIDKIRIVLAAGWVHNSSEGAGVVEFDDVSLLSLSELFFSNKPFENAIYEKISPVLWKVKMNLSQPSMLVFTESYDSLWVCYVNGEKISSVPLYGVINGFWINQTGSLNIVIEYEPQKWFNIGCVISITTFLACVAYLTFTYPKIQNILHKTLKRLFRGRSEVKSETVEEIPTMEIDEEAIAKPRGISEPEPIYVKSMDLHSLVDVQEVADELRAGNIVILDITTLMNQDPVELKRAIDQLKGICHTIGGDVGHLTESKVIATPKFVNIQFKKEPKKN